MVSVYMWFVLCRKPEEALVRECMVTSHVHEVQNSYAVHDIHEYVGGHYTQQILLVTAFLS